MRAKKASLTVLERAKEPSRDWRRVWEKPLPQLARLFSAPSIAQPRPHSLSSPMIPLDHSYFWSARLSYKETVGRFLWNLNTILDPCKEINNRHFCTISFQLEPERGFLPEASKKHDPWGAGLKNHPKDWMRKRYEFLKDEKRFELIVSYHFLKAFESSHQLEIL